MRLIVFHMIKPLCIFLLSSLSFVCHASYYPVPIVEHQIKDWKDLGFSIHSSSSSILNVTVAVYPKDSPVPKKLEYPKQALNLGADHPLRQAIFSLGTNNPFVKLFPDYYSTTAPEKYRSCNFAGIGFELDDDPATKEWLVNLAGEYCLFGRKGFLRGYDPGVHHWLIQREANGKYRVLLESEGIFRVITEKNLYKAITSQVYLEHAFRQEALKNPKYVYDDKTTVVCGGAEIDWRYQDGRYQPEELIPRTSGCKDYHHHLNPDETEREFVSRHFDDVIRRNLLWLKQVTGQCYDFHHKEFRLEPAACPGRFIRSGVQPVSRYQRIQQLKVPNWAGLSKK